MAVPTPRPQKIEMQIADRRIPVDTLSLDDTKMWLSMIEVSVGMGGQMTHDLQLVIDALKARKHELETDAFDTFLEELGRTWPGARAQVMYATLEARLMEHEYSIVEYV